LAAATLTGKKAIRANPWMRRRTGAIEWAEKPARVRERVSFDRSEMRVHKIAWIKSAASRSQADTDVSSGI